MNRRRACDRSTGHTARVSGPSGDRAGMTRQPRPRWADDIDDNDRAAPTDAAAGGGEKLGDDRQFSPVRVSPAVEKLRTDRNFAPAWAPALPAQPMPTAGAGRPLESGTATAAITGPRSRRLRAWGPRTAAASARRSGSSSPDTRLSGRESKPGVVSSAVEAIGSGLLGSARPASVSRRFRKARPS
jgi:hypothetical protein